MNSDEVIPPFDIDVYDEEFLARPSVVYDFLLENKPVFYSDRYKAWFVSRYQDVKNLLAAEVWEPSGSGTPPQACPHWAASRKEGDYPVLRSKSLQMQELWLSLRPDKADYLRLRTVFTPPLTPAKMAGFEPLLRTNVQEVLQSLDGRERIDLVADLAVPFTMKTIMAVFGIRDGRHEELKRYSNDLLGLLGLNPGMLKRERGIMAMINLLNYFADQGEGQSGTLYAEMSRQVKEGRMSHDELISNMVLMILAGQETTMQLIVSAFYCFMRFPDELRKVREQETSVAAFVEEVLRYESPAPYISKTLLTDTVVSDVHLPAKSKVVLLIGAANRDPRQFALPGEFHPARNEAQHLAFGFGQRYCLGAALSRTEARIVIQEFLARFPNFVVDPAQPVQWVNDFRIRGLQQLWLDLAPQQRT